MMKNCPKCIRHLRLFDRARRKLFWNCYGFVKFEKTRIRLERPESFADSQTLKRILSELETRLLSSPERV